MKWNRIKKPQSNQASVAGVSGSAAATANAVAAIAGAVNSAASVPQENMMAKGVSEKKSLEANLVDIDGNIYKSY